MSFVESPAIEVKSRPYQEEGLFQYYSDFNKMKSEVLDHLATHIGDLQAGEHSTPRGKRKDNLSENSRQELLEYYLDLYTQVEATDPADEEAMRFLERQYIQILNSKKDGQAA